MVAIAVKPAAIAPAAVVAICFGIAMLEGYDVQSMGVAMPALGPQLHLSAFAKGNALTAASVGLMIGALIGGWLADRIGRKPVLIGSVIWFAVFSLATVLVSDGTTLTLARLVTGLGFGGAMPNLVAIAGEISLKGRTAATTTTVIVGLPCGGGVAALVTWLSPASLDWRLIFIVGGLAPLLLAPIALWLLPETRPEVHAGADRRSLTALFGGGRAATTLLLWATFALSLTVLYLLLNWLPTLAHAKGLTRPQATLSSLTFNIGSITGGLVAGRLADRFGFRWPQAGAYFGLMLAMALLAWASGPAAVLALAGLAGLFVSASNYLLYPMSPQYYGAAVRGTGAGAAVSAGRVGSIMGPLVAGLLMAGGASAGQVVVSMVPVILAAGSAALLLTVVGQFHRD